MRDYATLLRDHVTLTCRSIDRLFLQAYVPKLQSVGQVCQFLKRRAFKCVSRAKTNSRFDTAELTWQRPGCGSDDRGCGGGPLWLAASLAPVEPCHWRRASAL